RDKKEEINLLEMTSLLLKDYDLLAKEREISIENHLTNQQTYLNPSVLKLILSNLISNAVKHSVQGGYLKIVTEDDCFF
ncbi:sensor histidine kinase, partial [Streptococcus pneumoniae]|nr:sensor histidine kinase [Streptococcus pneumoniae]